jgi:uncharacterized membrane protein
MVGALAAFICLAGFLTSIFFVVLEKHNRYIRFWAYQAMLVHSLFFVIFFILIIGMMASVERGWFISFWVFLVLQIIIGLLLAYQAYKGARTGYLFHLPAVGSAAAVFALNAAPPANPNPKLQML